MGTFVFRWEHAADEVYVTGTFDNWTKSVKLEKVGDVFEKEVELEDASQKVYYKFVVDNNWVTNDTAPKEKDAQDNENNVLTPDEIKKPDVAVMNTVTPESTTAAMAGDVPLEKATPSDVPGGFPATPANELDKTFSVNPLPAAAGAVNPVDLEPGEKVPETVGASSIDDNVKLDKESYEKSDALPSSVSHKVVEESPIVGAGVMPRISTVGPTSTTADLAGQVPLEAKVPEVVKESQDKAGTEPEASAEPEEVKEKAAVEEELLAKVPEAPSAAEGTAGVGTEKKEGSSAAAATAATAGGAVLASALAAKDTIVEKATPVVNQAAAAAASAADKNLPDSVKGKLPDAVKDAIATQGMEEKREEVAPAVPTEVKQSITEADKAPEAAASTGAVEAKTAVEEELKKTVEPAEPAEPTKPAEPAEPAAGAEAEPKKEEDKPSESQAETMTEATEPSSSKAEETKAEGLTVPTEKKKKNRLSTMLSKFKSKMK